MTDPVPGHKNADPISEFVRPWSRHQAEVGRSVFIMIPRLFHPWIFAAPLTPFFPSMVTWFAPGCVFGFFCFIMVLQLIWVKLMAPETEGRPLEQIEPELRMAES